MFKHILLPTDGSKLSQNAIKHGVRLARALKARITALTAIPQFHAFTYQVEMLEATREQFEQESARRAAEYLEFARKTAAAAGVKCDGVHVVSDEPYREIIKIARRRKCDLILMASHGRRGIAGFLLGSETQKVLTHSRVPVLVYR